MSEERETEAPFDGRPLNVHGYPVGGLSQRDIVRAYGGDPADFPDLFPVEDD